MTDVLLADDCTPLPLKVRRALLHLGGGGGCRLTPIPNPGRWGCEALKVRGPQNTCRWS